jgi:hypothetical protein
LEAVSPVNVPMIAEVELSSSLASFFTFSVFDALDNAITESSLLSLPDSSLTRPEGLGTD